MVAVTFFLYHQSGPNRDGLMLQFTFKHRDNGGIAIRAEWDGRWVAPDFLGHTTEHSFYLVPSETNKDWFTIYADPDHRQAFCDPEIGGTHPSVFYLGGQIANRIEFLREQVVGGDMLRTAPLSQLEESGHEMDATTQMWAAHDRAFPKGVGCAFNACENIFDRGHGSSRSRTGVFRLKVNGGPLC
ncbi:hypothetical protein B0H14DRAFT_3740928 [Mycena olivaceomarginata]|nr:hypothetical protein B0H14DRAFT_3740928 [Mycena olivaceomarginata]